MAGRGPQSFKKRQKEQQRKEKHEIKLAKRAERKRSGPEPEEDLELLAGRVHDEELGAAVSTADPLYNASQT